MICHTFHPLQHRVLHQPDRAHRPGSRPIIFLAERKAGPMGGVPKNWALANPLKNGCRQRSSASHSKSKASKTSPKAGYILLRPSISRSGTAYGACCPGLTTGSTFLKRELRWIPLFGQYIFKMRMVPGQSRGQGARSWPRVLERTKREIGKPGRQLIHLTLKGTRRAAGRRRRDYKNTALPALYRDLQVPVSARPRHASRAVLASAQVPALPGPFPRCRSCRPRSPPACTPMPSWKKLIDVMETASDKLLVEDGRSQSAGPPCAEDARRRLAELGAADSGAGSR